MSCILIIVLTEIIKTRQIKGEGRRRWFCSPHMDLIFWYDNNDLLNGFELCYDKESQEKSLSWRLPTKISYASVDPGEPVVMGYKMTPIHQPDEAPDFDYIISNFESESTEMPSELREMVLEVLSRQKDQ